ncbi:patatin-like phospholipase family protein [Alsobacter sp. SYSU M60028]|uniref:Patatin-like phospholipase family protein n=1 Tax=Alsobacter ponti TaxID=2962936 RepID=A0ABT1LEQ7_9HYPH|nr:patatin-like phospholipase family protein [Alsobacter ponti]MCP8939411.1 patatin-like phospholipase family protein [Alsobacter ponti]
MDAPVKQARKGSAAAAFEVVALVLQGGGALGSYQAGVYEALAKAGIHPNWVAGISIGAINSALIAGNPVEKRVERLRSFWETVSEPPLGPFGVAYNAGLEVPSHALHQWINRTRAFGIATLGAPGFFQPRFPSPALFPPGSFDELSYYDVSPLIATLQKLIDFELINTGPTRLSVGAVNVRTGNFVCFDSAEQPIDVRHVIASGSLPPGFPATEIDGEYYWDGGVVSNTPLEWVLGTPPLRNTLAFQVDLWSARGDLPRDFVEAEVRRKDIQFSSRTREVTSRLLNAQRVRHAFRRIHEQLPKHLRESEEGRFLASQANDAVYNLVHLIYHASSYEGTAKDFEFSRRTMEEHWRAGFDAATKSLSHGEVFRRPTNPEGFAVFDFSK